MNATHAPHAGDTGEEETRKHVEIEPLEVPTTVPTKEPVPA